MSKLFNRDNILIITQEFDYRAGAGIYAYELALSLSRSGASVHIMCPGLRTEKEIIGSNITVHRHRVISGFFLRVPTHHIQVWRCSKKIIKLSGITIIHSNNYGGAFVRRGRALFVATIHHPAREELKNVIGLQKLIFRADILFEKITIKRARLIIADSHMVEYMLKRIAPNKKIFTLPCGIDLHVFKKQAHDTVRKSLGIPRGVLILFCPGGARGKRKGTLDLFKALEGITTPAYRCVVTGGFGTTNLGWESEARLALNNANLADKFIFVDYVTREMIPKLYSAADIVVYPSLLEGFGLPALEALACERPFIGTKTGELPYIVKNGQNGLLVDVNSPTQLQEALETLMHSANTRKKLAKNARQSIANYSWDSLAISVLDLYKQTLEETQL